MALTCGQYDRSSRSGQLDGILWFITLVACFSTTCAWANSLKAPQLTVEGDAQAGYLTVNWHVQGRRSSASGDTPLTFELQQADSPRFETPHSYRGQQHGSVRSGLPNGTYYFRARARMDATSEWSPWSPVTTFSVKHHSLALSGSLFAVGFVVFVSTLSFLLVMSRREQT